MRARAAGRGPLALAVRRPPRRPGAGGAAFATSGSINSPPCQPASLRRRPEDLVEYADESRAPAPRYAQMTLSQQRRRFGVEDYRAFRESVCSQPPHNWYDSKPAVGAY